ncbi:hypothetical protein F2P56_026841 [Juglans regia]|uniref:Uncharacterized protein n=2 Tax=Juglans regia TaxID=51240 RepID=A0A833X8T4_JUGRE|nr:uncharacterized mitochondrial protein AtMg00310-like [Juglans regia]KAF5451765.1 hypothetical protein F2P56_026841 [Juglans regia]
MGIFLLPQTITQKLNILLKKFWWSYNEDHSKIPWVRWDQVSLSKDKGGLGFGDFRSFNVAMLAQGRRMLQDQSSLLAQVFKQKYYKNGNLLEAKLGFNPSYVWRSLYFGLRLLKKGQFWTIGDGKKLKIWTDKWIPRDYAPKLLSPNVSNDSYVCVSNLIDPYMMNWNV